LLFDITLKNLGFSIRQGKFCKVFVKEVILKKIPKACDMSKFFESWIAREINFWESILKSNETNEVYGPKLDFWKFNGKIKGLIA
jgi:hypothetical protein